MLIFLLQKVIVISIKGGVFLDRDVLVTLVGTMIGSIGEELLEAIQTGADGVSPEYKFAGEAIGAIVGFLSAKIIEKQEYRIAVKTFAKSLFKHVMKEELNETINDDEIKLFNDRFQELPKEFKMKYINAYKVAYPYEYNILFFQEV